MVPFPVTKKVGFLTTVKDFVLILLKIYGMVLVFVYSISAHFPTINCVL